MVCPCACCPDKSAAICVCSRQLGLATCYAQSACHDGGLRLQDPPWDSGSYAKVVTRDATPAAGAAEACAPNMRQAWQELFSASETPEGRQRIRDSMLLCPHAPLANRSSADALAAWLSNAFDYLVRRSMQGLTAPEGSEGAEPSAAASQKPPAFPEISST